MQKLAGPNHFQRRSCCLKPPPRPPARQKEKGRRTLYKDLASPHHSSMENCHRYKQSQRLGVLQLATHNQLLLSATMLHVGSMLDAMMTSLPRPPLPPLPLPLPKPGEPPPRPPPRPLSSANLRLMYSPSTSIPSFFFMTCLAVDTSSNVMNPNLFVCVHTCACVCVYVCVCVCKCECGVVSMLLLQLQNAHNLSQSSLSPSSLSRVSVLGQIDVCGLREQVLQGVRLRLIGQIPYKEHLAWGVASAPPSTTPTSGSTSRSTTCEIDGTFSRTHTNTHTHTHAHTHPNMHTHTHTLTPPPSASTGCGSIQIDLPPVNLSSAQLLNSPGRFLGAGKLSVAKAIRRERCGELEQPGLEPSSCSPLGPAVRRDDPHAGGIEALRGEE